jgi:hypothetical protein
MTDAPSRPAPNQYEMEADRYRFIDAAIDFIFRAHEDGLRKKTQLILAAHKHKQGEAKNVKG